MPKTYEQLIDEVMIDFEFEQDRNLYSYHDCNETESRRSHWRHGVKNYHERGLAPTHWHNEASSS